MKRRILYPSLQDNALVLQYPNVQGMQNNVFFLSHTNHENEEKDSVSKFNTFEVCRQDLDRKVVLKPSIRSP